MSRGGHLTGSTYKVPLNKNPMLLINGSVLLKSFVIFSSKMQLFWHTEVCKNKYRSAHFKLAKNCAHLECPSISVEFALYLA